MKKYSQTDIAEAIKSSRQNFWDGAMSDAQASLIKELCEKLEIDVGKTLSDDPNKNATWENNERNNHE